MWRNWAGNQTSGSPILRPRSEDELAQIICGAQSLRIVGSGHSFTPLIPGAEAILHLGDLEKDTILYAGDDHARVNANAQLKQLSPALASHGLAFRNLGDINEQTLAGAASTATHGTGKTLPCVAAEIRAATLMAADGTTHSTADNPDLLRAAQVSLGSLGVLLEVDLTLIPKHNLHRQVTLTDIDEAITAMHDNWQQNRNFEFFFIPYTGKAVELRHNLTDAAPSPAPRDLDNLAVQILRLARNAGRLSPVLRRAILKLLVMGYSDEDYVGEAWRVLCSQRGVPFVEMEYHVPPDAAADLLREVIKRTETNHPDIYFPIEVRQTAGDDAFLSPFQHGPRISIAIHASARDGYRDYFEDIEPLLRAAGGRPHWGKLHNLTACDLSDLYPDFNRFCEIRAKLDPTGKFLSPALATLFDEKGP